MFCSTHASKILQKILRCREVMPGSLSRPRPFNTFSTPSASLATPSSHENRTWSAVLLFIPGITTFGLGTWQLFRRQWKLDLLEYRQKRLQEDILPLDLAIRLARQSSQDTSQEDGLNSLEFKRVQCEGMYAEEKSIYLGPRGRSNRGVTERGYFLLTPLHPLHDKGGSVQVPVLVNRGWVPASWHNASPKGAPESNPHDDGPSDNDKTGKSLFKFLRHRKHDISEDRNAKVNTSKVVGVVRSSENPSMFVPSNEPESGQWFYVDVPAMACAVGLPKGTIYIEALREEANAFKMTHFPDPKDPDTLIRSSVMPQDHVNYAVTWYILSAATTFMAWKRVKLGVGQRSRTLR